MQLKLDKKFSIFETLLRMVKKCAICRNPILSFLIRDVSAVLVHLFCKKLAECAKIMEETS